MDDVKSYSYGEVRLHNHLFISTILLFAFGVCGGLVVSVLDCKSNGSGFRPQAGQKFGSRFLLHLNSLANSAMLRTLTIHCHREGETVRERTGQPPSYAEANNSLTPHTAASGLA